MEDFKFTIQYDEQKPLGCNTYFIQEDVLRMNMGLDLHKEDDDTHV